MSDQKLTKKDLNRIFLRMQGMNLTNNYESMQAVSFLTSITPAIERLYDKNDKDGISRAMMRHTQFFNSHVNGDAFILGIVAAMEEKTNENEKDSVTSIKTGLMGPLAGLGDSLIKFTWLPICGSIGASLALNGNVFGPILMFVFYNIVNMGLRYYGVTWGYNKGIEFLNGSESQDVIKRISNMANVVGLMVIGGLIASSVKLNIIYEIVVGENSILIQEMLDKVMPNLLGILLTSGLYFFFKKKQSRYTVRVIFILMILGIVFSYLGII